MRRLATGESLMVPPVRRRPPSPLPRDPAAPLCRLHPQYTARRDRGQTGETCLSKIARPTGSEPRLGLGRAFGAALGTFAGRVCASVAALRPQAPGRPSAPGRAFLRFAPEGRPLKCEPTLFWTATRAKQKAELGERESERSPPPRHQGTRNLRGEIHRGVMDDSRTAHRPLERPPAGGRGHRGSDLKVAILPSLPPTRGGRCCHRPNGRHEWRPPQRPTFTLRSALCKPASPTRP